jgi:TPR repeat protein
MKMNNYEYELLLELAENEDLFAMRELVSSFFLDRKSFLNYSTELSKDNDSSMNQKMFEYLKLLIEKGDSDSMHLLGAFYYSGETEFVEQNFSKGTYWYNEALKHEPLNEYKKYQSDTYNNLGYCYYYGRINKPDYKKAFLHFAKAACLQHPNAMYKIGDMYREGLYINKDIDKAFYWYNRAHLYSINDHYIKASVSLRMGRAYLEGEGTEISLLKALKYLQSAEGHCYTLLINKPKFCNSSFSYIPYKQVQELLVKVREQLNDMIDNQGIE